MGDFSEVLRRRALGVKEPPTLGTVTPDATDAAEVERAEMLTRWGFSNEPNKSVGAEALHRKVKRIGKQMAESVGTPLDLVKGLDNIPIPAEWERMIREFSPVSETHSWLMLAWKEPPFAPDMRRLVIYDCLPAQHINPEYRAILEDRPYWELPKGERHGRASICSAFQWWKWRTHKVKVSPVWVVQGNDGGTPAGYTEIERKWLRMLKKPDTVPGVGELPFAPFDQRVLDALAKRDRLRKLDGSIARMKARGSSDALKAETEAEERKYREAFYDWFTETMAPIGDEWKHSVKKSENATQVRKETREEFLQRVDARQRFIEKGFV